MFLPVHAAEPVVTLTEEEADYANLVTTITQVGVPYISGDYLIFTQKSDARYVGIAFDFENFGTIHPFMKRNTYDDDDKVESSFYFYMLKLTKTMKDIKYRVVIDGLWTLDPENSAKVYDRTTGLTLSYFDATRNLPPATEILDNGRVHFVYQGAAGQQIRVGGSFTNWDSWIYEMQEVKPGLYEFQLTLPPGVYEYAYFSGVTTIVDTTNPDRCFTSDGKKASRLVIKK